MFSLVSRAAFASVAFTSTSFATTWIVDASGGSGASFTDIPPAIAAASPGDVLLVQPGSYSGFVLDKGLAILGYGNVVVAGPAQVLGIDAPQRALLLDLAADELDVLGCTAAVVVRESSFGWAKISQSLDVRLAVCHLQSPDQHASTQPFAGVSVEQSRLEIEGSYVQGSGYPLNFYTGVSFDDGGPAFLTSTSARLHASRCVAVGGNGAAAANFSGQVVFGGNGGAGMQVQTGATAIVTGDGGESFVGGSQGWCANCFDCHYDGANGFDLAVENSTAYTSGEQFPDVQVCDVHCQCSLVSGVAGQTIIALSPSAPTLDASGSMSAGSFVTFTIHAPAGSFGTLNLGRSPVVVATPPVLIERLTNYLRVMNIAVPPSGVATRNVFVPSGLPPGFLFVAQAELTLPDGTLARTCSAPIVVR